MYVYVCMCTVRHNERKLCLVHVAGVMAVYCMFWHTLSLSPLPPLRVISTPQVMLWRNVSPLHPEAPLGHQYRAARLHMKHCFLSTVLFATRLFQQEWAALATFWQTDDECNFWSWEWWRSVLCVTDVTDFNTISLYCKRNYGFNMPSFVWPYVFFQSPDILEEPGHSTQCCD